MLVLGFYKVTFFVVWGTRNVDYKSEKDIVLLRLEFKDKNGGGQILFSEFIAWALNKNLDIEKDTSF